MGSLKNVPGFACNFPPSCLFYVFRICEISLGILINMSTREQRYNAQEALKRIWNDSGDNLDSDENEVESYELLS